MIVVLSGSNDYARSMALRKITETFIAEYGDFGLEKLDASDIELGRLLESVSSLPFLAPRRMIILSNIGANKLIAKHIEQLLESVADTTDLIIDERKFDKRLNVYKTLKKHADFQEFNELDERGLATWLVDEVTSRGGKLQHTDALHLINRAGPNQLGLHNELDKLLSYDPNITRDSINLLVEPLPRSSVFELLDAAFAGNHKKTIELYSDQRKQQAEPQYIFSMIAWQLHILAVVKFNETLSPDELAKKAKLNPFVVRKTLGVTRKLSRQQVKDLIHRALELDVRLKSESIDADDAVQHFLLSI